MVTNTSSFGDDWAAVSGWVQEKATDVGQAVGLLEDDLIPGEPAATGSLAENLTTLGKAFDRAGAGFKKVDTGGWHGQAADAANEHMATEIPKWVAAADAFTDAGNAVADYQQTLVESKAKAARAKAALERAEQASEAAREAHNTKVDSYNTAVTAANAGGPPPGAAPGAFSDPAAGERAAAQREIEQAQAAVQDAGDRAARVVRAAAEAAPPQPGLLAKIEQEFTDQVQSAGRMGSSFVGGALESAQGLANMARMGNPLDIYNLTHPAEFGEQHQTMAMGVVGAVSDPYAAVKTVVDVDGWRNDPARAAGSMVPDALASLAGGAGAASRIGRGVGKLGDTADTAHDVGRMGRHTNEATPPQVERPTPRPPSGTPEWGRFPEHSPQTPYSPQGQQVAPGQQIPYATPDYGTSPKTDGGAISDRIAPPVERTPDPGSSPNQGANSDRIVPDPEPSSPDVGESKYPENSPTTALDKTPHHGPSERGPDGLTADDRELVEMRRYDQQGNEIPELKPLSDRDLHELGDYRGSGYHDMNEALRSGDPHEVAQFQDKIDHLDNALEKLPQHDGVTEPVVRGFPLRGEDLDDLLTRYEPGSIVSEGSYTSTSKNSPFPGNVEMIIESNQGRDASVMRPGDPEAEVIFGRNAQFRVVSREFNEQTGNWELHLTDP